MAQGTPKRATFRIPSAYFMASTPTRENRSGGKVDFITFTFNTEGGPACLIGKGLEPWEKARLKDRKVRVSIKPGMSNSRFQDAACQYKKQKQKLESNIADFEVYKSTFGKCYVPAQNTTSSVFFICHDGMTGCTGYTHYENLNVQYGIRLSELETWKGTHEKVLRKVSTFLVGIYE